MKKTLASMILAVLACTAAAQTADPRINGMVASCSTVMGKAACVVENNDKRDCATAVDQLMCRRIAFNKRYPRGLLVVGMGAFTADDYFPYVDAGDKMCDVIVRSCSADFNSRGCLMARALWRQR